MPAGDRPVDNPIYVLVSTVIRSNLDVHTAPSGQLDRAINEAAEAVAEPLREVLQVALDALMLQPHLHELTAPTGERVYARKFDGKQAAQRSNAKRAIRTLLTAPTTTKEVNP